MKAHWTIVTSFMAAALLLAAGCGRNVPSERVGGETHWLSKCTQDDDCGNGQECLCGVCTVSCTESDLCSRFGERAECLRSAESAHADDCSSAAPSRLCALPCSEGECPDAGPEPSPTTRTEPTPPAPTGESVRARPYDDTSDCFGDSEVVGSIPLPDGGDFLECDDALTYALDTSDRCWLFSNGCVPDGFEQTSATGDHPCQQTTQICDELELHSIRGARYDSHRDCFGGQEEAGTMRAELGNDPSCDDALTYALSPERECWLFNDSCIPDGFTTPSVTLDRTTPDERACLEGADRCADAACAADEVQTRSEGCLSCADASLGLHQALDAYLESSGGLDCSVDEDCVAESWEVACGGECPRALAAAAVQSFRLELAELDEDYCGDPAWIDRCGFATPDCAPVEARCVDGRCASGAELPCESLGVGACQGEPRCAVVEGWSFDTDNSCLRSPEAVGCQDAELACPPSGAAARDADGDCYYFGNCVPDGFTPAPAGSECEAAAAAPSCD